MREKESISNLKKTKNQPHTTQIYSLKYVFIAFSKTNINYEKINIYWDFLILSLCLFFSLAEKKSYNFLWYAIIYIFLILQAKIGGQNIEA